MVETVSQIPANFLRAYPKPDLMLFKQGGSYTPVSTQEVYDRVKAISLGLRGLGCRPGDKLVILSENRPEWVWTDLANLGLGGVTEWKRTRWPTFDRERRTAWTLAKSSGVEQTTTFASESSMMYRICSGTRVG